MLGNWLQIFVCGLGAPADPREPGAQKRAGKEDGLMDRRSATCEWLYILPQNSEIKVTTAASVLKNFE